MAELGIGVRVRSGWHPEMAMHGVALASGAIQDGPFDPGHMDVDALTEQPYMIITRSWNVLFDHDQDTVGWCVPERYLFPIDGDGRINETDTETSPTSVEA